MERIKKWLFICNIILAASSVLAFASPYVDPSSVWPISILGLSYSGQIALHTIFIIVWLPLQPIRIWLSAIFIIIELSLVNGFIHIAPGDPVEYTDPMLTVATLNLQFSKELIDAESTDIIKFSDFLKSHNDIDVFCLQELGQRNKSYIERSMTFPYSYTKDNLYIGIYSKYPIINKGLLPAQFNSSNNCLWVDILYKEDTIRVYNAHLESNRYDGIVPTLVDQDQEEIINSEVYLGLLHHYVTFSKMRDDQAKVLSQHRQSIAHPTIICGDFNDIPLSRVYHNVSVGLYDTFNQKGHGMGTTLKSSVPGLRIDYILITPDWKTLDHRISEDTFSDHNLIKSDLEIQ